MNRFPCKDMSNAGSQLLHASICQGGVNFIDVTFAQRDTQTSKIDISPNTRMLPLSSRHNTCGVSSTDFLMYDKSVCDVALIKAFDVKSKKCSDTMIYAAVTLFQTDTLGKAYHVLIKGDILIFEHKEVLRA